MILVRAAPAKSIKVAMVRWLRINKELNLIYAKGLQSVVPFLLSVFSIGYSRLQTAVVFSNSIFEEKSNALFLSFFPPCI